MDQDEYSIPTKKVGKQHNTLPLWGNEATMNLNPLILANIQGSSYFKVHLFKLKTYHEVVDEIYYQVKHLEPWERGSRKTSGQTGMCGGVRGVGAGGIVSTAFCLLYKLYTLRLTRKQVNGLLNHSDSPYIRALGFMYIRFTQPPSDLFDWYEDYFQDEEEIDVKAGGGQNITIGHMAHQFLTKLDWFSTLFPRIPVPMQKMIEKKLEEYCRNNHVNFNQASRPSVSYARPSAGSGETPDLQEFRNGGHSSNNERGREKYVRESHTRPRYNDRSDFRDRERSTHKREDRYDKPRSRSVEKSDRREKHKKRHKHRSRSDSRERRNRDRNDEERSHRNRNNERRNR